MATVPAKSHQPLHNFSLPCLKWGQSRTHVNTSNRCRRLLSHRRPSPATDSDDSFESDRNKLSPSRNRSVKTSADAPAAAATPADGEVKPWNLRPRKSATASAIVNVLSNTRLLATSGGKTAAAAEEEREEEEKKKRKLWISLSKEEIEEDVYALSGSKPARRPKKRNKTVQKQLDNLFPGLYLVGVSADSYRV